MTHQNDYTLTSELAEIGLDAIPELVCVMINNAMQAEKSKYLQAESMYALKIGRATSTRIS